MPHGSMQASMSLLAALGAAVVAMGWRRRGSRRSVLHLSAALHGTTRHLCSLLFSSLPPPPKLPFPTYPACALPVNWHTLLGAPAAWTHGQHLICLCLYSFAGRRCVPTLYFVQDQQDPFDHCRYHMPALCVCVLTCHNNTTCLVFT